MKVFIIEINSDEFSKVVSYSVSHHDDSDLQSLTKVMRKTATWNGSCFSLLPTLTMLIKSEQNLCQAMLYLRNIV